MAEATANDSTTELGREGSALRGVAGDGRTSFAAIATGDRSAIQAPTWSTSLTGVAGPIAYAGGQVIASLGGTTEVAGLAMRGEPGAALAALDGATGTVRWKLAVDATEWAVIAAIAATPDGVAIAGSFQGTLRIGAQVVASAGKSDGFVARLSLAGEVRWLVRVGGDGADAIAGVALAGDRVAIAGSFAAGADVLGELLPAVDERSLLADAFVAELDREGHRVWAKAFGGDADDHVAGVAIDGAGRVVVAAIARGTMHVDGAAYTARGAADGLVVWFSPAGVPGEALLVGGTPTGICAAAGRIVIGGGFTGAPTLGERAMTASGDDAFLAELDDGKVRTAWQVGGAGREEIVALSPISGGFVAGVAHTAAATIDDATLPAPQDPLGGFAVITRGIR